MIILCGPSASGKTEVARLLSSKYQIKKSVTTTTRPMRVHEVADVDYHFITKEKFLSLSKEDYFVETMTYNDHFYGCGKNEVQDNRCVILDPEGVYNFLKLNNPHLMIFVLLASPSTCEKRMNMRHDDPKLIKKRLESDIIRFRKENLSFASKTIVTDDKSIEEITDLVYSHYQNRISKK